MKYFYTILFVCCTFLYAKDYTKVPEVQRFVADVASEYNLSKEQLDTLFGNVTIQKTPLKLFRPRKKIKRTPEQIARLKRLYPKYGAWDRYSRLKINPSRVSQGVDFIKRYRKIFEAVEEKYGVPKEYVAAIIGVETVYGSNVGKFPVFDTLVTLAFEKNRRNRFFKKELKKFLHLCHTQDIDPKHVYGSYAGAIGLGQFMPSNYEAYGVDFDGDGHVTLQQPEDAIASIANYFKKNGWRRGEPVATRVSYEGMRFRAYKTGYRRTYERKTLRGIEPKEGHWDYQGKVRLIKLNRKHYDELWYGTKNFFVITRYNHSAYYAMAIHQLAQKIKKGLKSEN